MAMRRRGIDLKKRAQLRGGFAAVPTQDTNWSRIATVIGGFARVDGLPKVFVFIVRNGDLAEILPDIVGSIESLYGFGHRLSLRVVEEDGISGRPVGPSILRLGIECPATPEKASHLMTELDAVWDACFEASVRGRMFINYDY